MFDRYVGCGMSGNCYRYIAFVQLNEDKCDYFVLSFRVFKGADFFQKGGRTKKQAAGRGTSRYSIGIKS